MTVIDKNMILEVLRDGTKNRTIYESGDRQGRGTGRFYIDFAAYRGGTSEEIPRALIEELEQEGMLTKAFPQNPTINAWVLRKAAQP